MSRSLKEAGIAEFLGTFALCFIGAGAVCVNQWSGGALGLLGVAVAHGTVLAVMISALGHISGGHFNPAITIGMLTANKITLRPALTYLIAQLSGAAAAGFLLQFIIPSPAWQPVHLGAPSLGPGITIVQAVTVETVLTFFLALAVCGVALDPKGSWNAVAGFGIGTVLIFDILVGGLITGAAMNPARAFGPALAAGYWNHHAVYWFGPLTGAVLATFLYTTVFLKSSKR